MPSITARHVRELSEALEHMEGGPIPNVLRLADYALNLSEDAAQLAEIALRVDSLCDESEELERRALALRDRLRRFHGQTAEVAR